MNTYTCIFCKDRGVVYAETDTDDVEVLCHLCDARQDVGAEWRLERGKVAAPHRRPPRSPGDVEWTLVRGRQRLPFTTVLTGDHTGVTGDELRSYLGWDGMEMDGPGNTRRKMTCVLIGDRSHEMGAAFVLNKIRLFDAALTIALKTLADHNKRRHALLFTPFEEQEEDIP